MSKVTVEDLHDLLDAPKDTSLVVEDGHARVVAQDDAPAEHLVVVREDLVSMLGGHPEVVGEQTLTLVADGLDAAVKEQGE